MLIGWDPLLCTTMCDYFCQHFFFPLLVISTRLSSFDDACLCLIERMETHFLRSTSDRDRKLIDVTAATLTSLEWHTFFGLFPRPFDANKRKKTIFLFVLQTAEALSQLADGMETFSRGMGR